jgi:hypothetical protein
VEGSFEHGNRPSGSIKQLAVSHEGLNSMSESVSEWCSFSRQGGT